MRNVQEFRRIPETRWYIGEDLKMRNVQEFRRIPETSWYIGEDLKMRNVQEPVLRLNLH